MKSMHQAYIAELYLFYFYVVLNFYACCKYWCLFADFCSWQYGAYTLHIGLCSVILHCSFILKFCIVVQLKKLELSKH